MKRVRTSDESGYTIVELMIAIILLGVIVYSTFQLFTALVNSALLMKRKAVALSLSTNQMEYIKSLPYNTLFIGTGGVAGTTTKKVDGITYTITTSINYVDDAFDGCGSYPTTALKLLYCRNYPPPTSMTSVTDTNAGDYKIVHVSVTDKSGLVLGSVDSQIAARVAETASNTGAIFVQVIDANGNPLPGATVRVTNTTVTPNVDRSDSSDSNGIAIFYGLLPDTSNYDYMVTASLPGYSTLSTIPPSGTLQPTYPSLQLITQQSSYATLQLKPMGTNSLVIETTNTSGTPLANVKVYVKGGYKKYTSTADTTYYYDTMSPSDTRITTDTSGMGALTNLTPGGYYFCGDTGATSCVIGSTPYYLAAAVPYGGVSAFSPITVPTYLASSPPTTFFSYSGLDYLQKVRLIMTTSSTAPRITSLSPSEASQGTSPMSAFAFTVKGANLPCSATAGSCATVVKLYSGSTPYTASCTGTSAGLQLNCTVNISAAPQGWTQLEVTANSTTITIPATPALLGGINVVP